ncbi:hypothetical protein ACVXG8_27640 [Escherichia coli]
MLNADLTTAGVTGGAETVAGSVTAVMSGAVCCVDCGSTGASTVRLFIYSPVEAAQSPALQISASTWGLNGKVIFIIRISRKSQWSANCHPQVL